MKQFLVIALVTCSFVTCDSDQSSSQESYESSEELFGEPKYHMQCVDFVRAEDVESCFAKKCEAECATSNIRVAKGSKTVLESCGWGCANQVSTFKVAQNAFRQTSPELLLGTAVDKCWDGCIEMWSDSDQAFCISGCEAMRKIQKNQLRPNKENERKGAEPEETKKDINSEPDGIQEDTENSKVNDDVQTLVQREDDPGHIRTNILWHPMDQQHAYQAYSVMMNIVQRMFQEMDDNDSIDYNESKGGWKDDRRQLRIPQFQPKSAALTSTKDEATEVYDKVVNSLAALKTKIQDTVSQPEFKENMFYCLMTICCFLLLVALYDNCTEETRKESEEDHFLLPDKAATVKLPSYEECIKADKYFAVEVKDANGFKDVKDLKEADEIPKKDLTLSLSVVIDDESSGNK